METDGIPAEHVIVIKSARDRISFVLSDSDAIADELERIYRLGKSQGRIEGHDLAAQTVAQYFSDWRKKMERKT